MGITLINDTTPPPTTTTITHRTEQRHGGCVEDLNTFAVLANRLPLGLLHRLLLGNHSSLVPHQSVEESVHADSAHSPHTHHPSLGTVPIPVEHHAEGEVLSGLLHRLHCVGPPSSAELTSEIVAQVDGSAVEALRHVRVGVVQDILNGW